MTARVREANGAVRTDSLRGRALAVGAVFLVATAQGARGENATLEIQSSTVWEGQTAIVVVTVENPTSTPSRPTLAAGPGLVVRGPSSPMSRRTVVGNRRTTTISYQFQVTPPSGRTGTFTVGPATIPLDGGKTLTTNAVELKVYKKPDAGVRFECEMSRPDGPVMAPFQVTYWIKYTGELDDDNDGFFSLRRSAPFGLTQLDLPIMGVSGLNLKPIRVYPTIEAATVTFQDGSQILVQQGISEGPDGTAYKAVVFGFEARPLVTGTVEIPAANVAIRMRTGRIVEVDDFPFKRRAPEVVEYKATSNALRYRVQELPRDGRPPGFTGAVGKFRVDVTAEPTEVDEYAPITLTVKVQGTGMLEDLRAPDWTQVGSITRDFEVPADVDSGKLEGNTKTFRQIIRPKNAEVRQIPPIPFPYYDPQGKRYEVAQSEPIAIQVRPVETVGVDEAIPTARTGPTGGSTEAPAAPSISERAGIGANFRDLGKNRSTLDPREQVFQASFLAALVGPPLLYGLFLVVLRWTRRDPMARNRSRRLSEARSVLQRGGDEVALCDAYQAYLRARLELPPGEVTPPDLGTALRAAGVSDALQSRARRLLEKLLAGRFGGTLESVSSLHDEAVTIARELDRCKID